MIGSLQRQRTNVYSHGTSATLEPKDEFTSLVINSDCKSTLRTTHHRRRLRKIKRTTTMRAISRVPGHRKKPRSLLYPPTTTQPDDSASKSETNPNFFMRHPNLSLLPELQFALPISWVWSPQSTHAGDHHVSRRHLLFPQSHATFLAFQCFPVR